MVGNGSGDGDRTSGRMRQAVGSVGDWLVRWSREGPEQRAARRAAQKSERVARRAEWAATVTADYCRWLRWPLAAAVILGTLIVDLVSLNGGSHLACQVTITPAGTTTVCGALDVADYAPALAVALLLLTPWWRVKYVKGAGVEVGLRNIAAARDAAALGDAPEGAVAPTADVLLGPRGVSIELWSTRSSLRPPLRPRQRLGCCCHLWSLRSCRSCPKISGRR